MLRYVRAVVLSVTLAASAVAIAPAQAQTELKPTSDRYKGAYAVDAGGRPIRALEIGSTLHVGAHRLRPGTTYEFRLGFDSSITRSRERAVSFARVTANRDGEIPPFVLWYESGVIGCSDQERAGTPRRPNSYRTFEEAERVLRGKMLAISAHVVQKDESGRVPGTKLSVEEAPESMLDLPVVPRKSPVVYASKRSGCMLNSQLTGGADLYVSGRSFRPGETLEISVAPNQRAWHVGDIINDVTGVSFAAAPKTVKTNAQGRFTVRVWDRANQRRGAYDIVAHRPSGQPAAVRRVGSRDIVSFGAETGFVFYLRYPVGGPTMDIAGRPLSLTPYFEFADSFAETNDPVWGAVDPTYIPVNHPGGTYAAYYVVQHRDVAGWNPQMGGATNLVDVSGGIEVHPVKSWCVNGTDVIIWQPPLNPGNYDVVVDFGQNPAATPQQYVTDQNYDASLDFLDGADQIGFVVTKDPYELGPVPIGEDSYSQDNFFATLGGATDVDLRAVVRYPATAPGQGQPVAAGQHPIFVIEHGNHNFCRIVKSGKPYWQAYADALQSGDWTEFSDQYLHSDCPDRELNHMGYMRLLNILASHGIIAVSIDAYDLTGPVPGWISERGALILKHLELWSHMNNVATFQTYPDFFNGRFANHVDTTKISVSGHSRGGEASVSAYMQNNAFSITAVSSIAPVDFNGYVLPDVPYFLILPAADGDVSDLEGMRIYDRAGSGLQPADATLKSGIDVYGASHNFFNSIWAADIDDGNPNRIDFIPAVDQQRLGEAFLAAFTRIHLNNEVVYLDLMRGKLSFPSFAGRKVYSYHHEKNHSKLEDGSGAGAAVPVVAGGAVVVSANNPSVHQTKALQVSWNANTATVTYTVPMQQRDASNFEVLSFRAAQTNANTNPMMGGQDFRIELVGGGTTKAVYVGQFGPIPKPYDRGGFSQNVMTTVRVPLHSFIMNNAGVTLNNIDTVRMKFTSPSTGELYVDDIEFSR